MATAENLIFKINNGDNKVFRELYGNDPAGLKRNAERYSKLLNQFKSAFGTSDVEFYSSPGRTEIGSNHIKNAKRFRQ
jgi:galactokinase